LDPEIVSVAFQISVTLWPSGQAQATVQPCVGTEPLFVTVNPSWKPPLHEVVSDHAAEQLGADEPVPVAVAVAVADADCEGVCDGDEDAVAVADALAVAEVDALTEAEAEADADADCVGCAPVPPLSTTIDSAGTETVLPEKALLTTVGFAASYTYSVSDELVRPSDAVLIEYATLGLALTNITL